MELTKHAHLTRQLDLIPLTSLDLPVNVIGVGAIGSFAVLSLAKMGMRNITVWDHDEVSVENMSNQFFRFKDIGANKATSLASLVYDFTGVTITAHPRKYDTTGSVDQDKLLQGIVISAVDSMQVRREIYESLLLYSKGVRLLIDPRMGAEVYLQFALKLRDEWYKATLYSDKDAVQEACTAKSTVYTAGLAAGMITKTVKNFITNQPYPKNVSWDIKASKNPMQMFPSQV